MKIKDLIQFITSFRFQDTVRICTISLGLGISILDVIIGSTLPGNLTLFIFIGNFILYLFWGPFLYKSFSIYKNTLKTQDLATKDYILRWLGVSNLYLLLGIFFSALILCLFSNEEGLPILFSVFIFIPLTYASKHGFMNIFLYPIVSYSVYLLGTYLIYSMIIHLKKKLKIT